MLGLGKIIYLLLLWPFTEFYIRNVYHSYKENPSDLFLCHLKKKKRLTTYRRGTRWADPQDPSGSPTERQCVGKIWEKLKDIITTHSKTSVLQQIHLHIAPASMILQALAFIPLLYSLILKKQQQQQQTRELNCMRCDWVVWPKSRGCEAEETLDSTLPLPPTNWVTLSKLLNPLQDFTSSMCNTVISTCFTGCCGD